MKKLNLVALTATLLLLLGSCTDLVKGSEQSGSLNISFDTQALTLVADWNGVINSYTVTLTSQDGYAPLSTSTSNTSAYFESVTAGTWDIGVKAYSGTTLIGTGSTTINIYKNSTQSVSIALSFSQANTGGFSYTFEFASSTGVDYVEGQLFKLPEDTLVGSTIVPALSSSGSYTQGTIAQNDLPSGAYRLALTFKRGGTSGIPAALLSESVNIWDGVVSDQWLDSSGNLNSVQTFASTTFNSANSFLSNLSVTSTAGLLSLNPGFSSAVLAYQAGSSSAIQIQTTEAVSGQQVQYQVNSGTWVELLDGISSDSISIVDTGTTIQIQVTAPDKTTTRCYTLQVVSPAPDGLAGSSGANQITLTWPSISSASSYNVTYSSSSDMSNAHTINTSGSPCVISDLNGNTPYYVRYTFVDSLGESLASTSIKVVPTGYTFSANDSGCTLTGYSGTLSTLSIPETCEGVPVTKIGDSAFYSHRALTGNLTIPSSVTSIGSYAFYDCLSLTGSLTIPSSVTSIGSSAFACCDGLNGNLTIPSSVISIGSYAFNFCYGFTGNLTIPSSVISIGSYAFASCYGFTGNLTIPNSVTLIEDNVFDGCKGLTGNLTIPSSVISIGSSAFAGCKGLTGNLTIPSSVMSIGSNAFAGCKGLTGNLTIPSSVISIGSYAFASCYGFTGKLTIPNSVGFIGSYAFYNCYSLTGNLTIPSSVTSIGSYAFYFCYGFTGNLTIPSSVTSIGSYAFYFCYGFTGNLTIPSSVTSIGSYAFYGCWLSSVTLKSTIPPTLNAFSNAFDNTVSGFKIHVPASTDDKVLAAYKAATGWSDYASYIVSP